MDEGLASSTSGLTTDHSHPIGGCSQTWEVNVSLLKVLIELIEQCVMRTEESRSITCKSLANNYHWAERVRIRLGQNNADERSKQVKKGGIAPRWHMFCVWTGKVCYQRCLLEKRELMGYRRLINVTRLHRLHDLSHWKLQRNRPPQLFSVSALWLDSSLCSSVLLFPGLSLPPCLLLSCLDVCKDLVAVYRNLLPPLVD